MSDATLMGISPDEIKRLGNELSHREYLILKIDATREALAFMLKEFSLYELESIEQIELMKYRRKSIDWLEKQLEQF